MLSTASIATPSILYSHTAFRGPRLDALAYVSIPSTRLVADPDRDGIIPSDMEH